MFVDSRRSKNSMATQYLSSEKNNTGGLLSVHLCQ